MDIPDLLACPNCKGPVVRQTRGFFCPRCQRNFPLDDSLTF